MSSQIRKFIAGESDVKASYALDVLVWLNFEGYKRIRVHGHPPVSLVARDEHASVSLERFLSKNIEYLFRQDLSQIKVEELYLRFTNRMDFEDANIVYLATEGKLDIDPDFAREYAGDRRFPDGAYIFRDEYLVETPAPKSEEPKKEEKSEPTGTGNLDSLGGDLTPIEDDDTGEKIEPVAKPDESKSDESKSDESKSDEKTETKPVETTSDESQKPSESTGTEQPAPRRRGGRRKAAQQPEAKK